MEKIKILTQMNTFMNKDRPQVLVSAEMQMRKDLGGSNETE